MSLLRRLFGRFRRDRAQAPAGAGLTIEPLDSVQGFRLSGDLDLFTVNIAREALEAELPGTLVLDLTQLEFIDDTGLGFLVGTFKRLRQQGGSLVLRHPRGPVLRALEMTGIAKLPGLTIEGAAGEGS